jgi:hypothetical protein
VGLTIRKSARSLPDVREEARTRLGAGSRRSGAARIEGDRLNGRPREDGALGRTFPVPRARAAVGIEPGENPGQGALSARVEHHGLRGPLGLACGLVTRALRRGAAALLTRGLPPYSADPDLAAGAVLIVLAEYDELDGFGPPEAA